MRSIIYWCLLAFNAVVIGGLLIDLVAQRVEGLQAKRQLARRASPQERMFDLTDAAVAAMLAEARRAGVARSIDRR